MFCCHMDMVIGVEHLSSMQIAMASFRQHDLRNPINVDGIVFVRGDVFVEGWYKW